MGSACVLRVCWQPVVNQEFYSSELFTSTYPVETCVAQPPGVKWAAKKFNSGIHPSADNERFIAMRDANVDRRPYAGGPYASSSASLDLDLSSAPTHCANIAA